MELLPAQLSKLKWLRKNAKHMKVHDAEYIKEIASILSASSKLEVHPITVVMIEGMYDCYRPLLKQKGVV